GEDGRDLACRRISPADVGTGGHYQAPVGLEADCGYGLAGYDWLPVIATVNGLPGPGLVTQGAVAAGGQASYPRGHPTAGGRVRRWRPGAPAERAPDTGVLAQDVLLHDVACQSQGPPGGRWRAIGGKRGGCLRADGSRLWSNLLEHGWHEAKLCQRRLGDMN